MSKIARTHDISLIDYHVTDVETLGKVLNNAIAAACPRSGEPRYKEVYVLLLSWEEDDLGVDAEIDDLEVVFRDIYGYNTGRWKIPSSTSHNALVFRLMQSLSHFESSEKLFITYYAGHGYMNDDRHIQTMLEEAACDVLILLDCCAAGSSGGNAGQGVTEVIAACGFEAFAPGVGLHSFTSNLIDELRYLGQSRKTFTSAFLHNKVLARLKKSWNPRYALNEKQERRRTPIYIHLADGGKQRCVELGPLRRSSSVIDSSTSTLQSVPSAASSAPSTSQSSSEDIDMLGLEDISQSSISSDGCTFTEPHVLISVALEGDQMLRTSDWAFWLKDFPAIARSVHIEGLYKSNSTLLHLSLPVAVWDLIPRDAAISFLAFINTNNLPRSQGYKTLRPPEALNPKSSSSDCGPFTGHVLESDQWLSEDSVASADSGVALSIDHPYLATGPPHAMANDFQLFAAPEVFFAAPEVFRCHDQVCIRQGMQYFISQTKLDEHIKKVHSLADEDVGKEGNRKKRRRSPSSQEREARMRTHLPSPSPPPCVKL
ncbi:MAG: hypothetical protein LQ350_005718 [Teloschistes chrysophthalmus]|nr:MAG: hypothetical protein LQ350_005718 [Niorma chrysophthalma]